MKIGIHYEKKTYSELWVQYCILNNIDYKIVNAYDNDIISHLADCDIFMWHTNHMNYKDKIFAKQLLFSLQMAGKKVYPDYNTVWHFDDKLGQKYLFESMGFKTPQSYVFYTKKEAMSWIKTTSLPKVFKLRGGGGSWNVRLMKTQREASKYINKAFGSGFNQMDPFKLLQDRIKRYMDNKDTLWGVIKGIGRLFIPTTFNKHSPKEKGYFYCQEFIPNQKFDLRLQFVDGKCWAMKRMVRKNDFRASGSNMMTHNHEEIPLSVLEAGFELNRKLKVQTCALDYVINDKNEPLLIEISYCYGRDLEEKNNEFYVDEYTYGYWETPTCRVEGTFNPEYWMVEMLLKSE